MQRSPETERLWRECQLNEFRKFIHDPQKLDVATDLLVFCQQGVDCLELLKAEEYSPKFKEIIYYLREIGLLKQLEPATFYKTAPGALKELMYRIEHDGEPSPPKLAKPAPDLADLCARARAKVKASLAASGFYEGKQGQRLRVVG